MVGIAVLLKQVPDTTARISVSGGRVDESAITSWVTSPYDEYALEVAIQHKETSGASITAITLGPPRADKVLKDAAALGVENLVRVWDDAWESLDSNQVQSALASTLESVGADWIYCGKQSADRNQGSTGPGVAERLGMACIVEISDWDVTGAQPSFTRATSSGDRDRAAPPERARHHGGEEGEHRGGERGHRRFTGAGRGAQTTGGEASGQEVRGS